MTRQERVIKKSIEIIENAWKKCPLNKQTALYLELEAWATNSLGDEESELFLEALRNAPCTQNTQLVIAVHEAVKEIVKKEDDK